MGRKKKQIGVSTRLLYEPYVRRWEASGLTPDQFLDTLRPGAAKNARSALLWAGHVQELRWREVVEKRPRALSHAQLAELRMAADGDERLAVDWLYYTAARLGEFMALRPGHVEDGKLLLPRTKTGLEEHRIPLHSSLDPSTLPFPRKRTWVQKRLRLLGERLGFRVHAHVLRSTAATHMLERGVTVPVLQRILGHASIETTLRYLDIGDDLQRQALGTLE
jgi:integrase